MLFERIKSEGTAHNSYMVGSGGEAVVIDPRRDCEIYLETARKHGMKIVHVLETHRNEDFAIGSTELNHFTGVDIYHGPGLEWGYGHTLQDGEELRFGHMLLKAIHTPGHTDESMSYAAYEGSSENAPLFVFTGDALFVNDVGRIDLYGEEEAPRLAGALYDSIFNRILPLGDGVILCPGHGAGSVCGKNIAQRDESTIGLEKLNNPWLQIKDRKEFIKLKSAEKLERPNYFRKMEVYNLDGPPLLGNLPVPEPLSPSEFEERMKQRSVVVDTRFPAAFGGAHIKGSYSIWLEGLTVFGGWVLPYDRQILLVTENYDDADTAVRCLVRAGYDNIEGFLYGGIENWYNRGLPVEPLPVISVDELYHLRLSDSEDIIVLDVREEDEFEEGHLEGSMNIYVGRLEENLDEIPRDKKIAVMCTVGHRAGLASSILLREGFEDVCNILGGYGAWEAAGYPTTAKRKGR